MLEVVGDFGFGGGGQYALPGGAQKVERRVRGHGAGGLAEVFFEWVELLHFLSFYVAGALRSPKCLIQEANSWVFPDLDSGTIWSRSSCRAYWRWPFT